MYNATWTIVDDHHHASTVLHMDLTDAVNLMVWAAKGPDGKPGYALWHIFPPGSVQYLRKFLVEVVGFTGPGDAIHSQQICMTPTLLDQFYDEYKIRPYTILQRPGEAVYIPAGCPHQVDHKPIIPTHARSDLHTYILI